MSDEIQQQIKKAAGSPKRVSVDGQNVDGRSLEELIKADRYMKSQEAAKSPSKGLNFSKLIPPGAG
jgi:hypothetical protein